MGQQAETKLLAGGPDTLFIGEVAARDVGQDVPRREPRDGRDPRHGRRCRRRRRASALDAAVDAAAEWAATAPRARGEILRQAFELVMQHREHLIVVQSARADVAAVAKLSTTSFGSALFTESD